MLLACLVLLGWLPLGAGEPPAPAPGAGAARVPGNGIISPASGRLSRGQQFDLVLFEPPNVSRRTATLNGIDVSAALGSCIRGSGVAPSTFAATLRCPGLSGALLESVVGGRAITFTVTLDAGSGTTYGDTAEWLIPAAGDDGKLPGLLWPLADGFATTQSFDVVVMVPDGLPAITGAAFTFDGADVTAAVLACLTSTPIETLPGFGIAARCPGLKTRQIFPRGIVHPLDMTLHLADGSSLQDSIPIVPANNTESFGSRPATGVTEREER